MYYLRTKPAVSAIKFTLDNEMLDRDKENKETNGETNKSKNNQ